MAKERILIQLDDVDMERIRLLSFQTRTPFASIVRQCVRTAIDKVEKEVIADAKTTGKLSHISPAEVERMKLLGEEAMEPAGAVEQRPLHLQGADKVERRIEHSNLLGEPTKEMLLDEIEKLRRKVIGE